MGRTTQEGVVYFLLFSVPSNALILEEFLTTLSPYKCFYQFFLLHASGPFHGQPSPMSYRLPRVSTHPTSSYFLYLGPFSALRGYRGCNLTKKHLQWRKLRNTCCQTPSRRHFAYKTISTGKSSDAGAENRVPETPQIMAIVR